MGRLAGVTAIVTGGVSGIGAASAELFAKEGAKVVICDLDPAACDAAAARIGPGALACAMDVRRAEDWVRAFDEAEARFGRVDVLMNNAGVSDSAALEDATVEDFDRVVEVNLKGVFLGCREAVRRMKTRPADLPAASIINVSSTAGFIGTVRTGIYTMTKGGVRLFSKSVAVEVAAFGYNIRCNSLHPGGTETPLFDKLLAKRGVSREDFAEQVKTRNPMGRLARPAEIAAGALFLASDESSFMTGTELALDGGYAAR